MVIMNNVNTTERLIQEVRARPPLWDQRNLNYHNRIVVNALWQDIADLLQVNKETVKVKWKGLRDTYRRELKKQRNNANTNNIGEIARDPSWTHYSSMNFLREYMGSNNNHNDLFQFHGWSTEDIPPDESSPSEETFNSFVSSGSIMDLIPSKTNDESVSGDETTKELQLAENDKSNSPSHDVTTKDQNSDKKKSTTARFSRLKEHRLRTKLSRKYPKVHRTIHQPTLHEDSDDDLYFFKSLIPYVKNLPPTRKLFLRSEIHNLVLREIMGDNSSHSVIPLEHVTVGLNG